MVTTILMMVVPVFFILIVQPGWRAYASANRYNVEICGNGPYCLVHAFLDTKLNYNDFYALQNPVMVQGTLRSALQEPDSHYTGRGIRRYVDNTNSLSGKNPNIVLIFVESLGAGDMESFGGSRTLVPYLDELAQQSYTFTNMLASGQRVVRGLEAVSLSMPPTPGLSLIRRDEAGGIDTWGEVLNGLGYKSDFLYGGYGYFDNMGQFFSRHGYTVTDRSSLPQDSLGETIWGVPDEVVLKRVLQSLDSHYDRKERAFETVLTMNHRPYEFPAGRVNTGQGNRKGGLAYTDWAIHQFLEEARQRPWFSNTVFVIVSAQADEGSGQLNLSVSRSRIPCMVYAPELVAPGVNPTLMGQMDLAPTVMGMLGLSYESSFLGYDAACIQPEKARSFISTYRSLGYVKDGWLVVLDPGKQVRTYAVEDWQTGAYVPVLNQPSLMAEAVSWYQGASRLYKQEWQEASG